MFFDLFQGWVHSFCGYILSKHLVFTPFCGEMSLVRPFCWAVVKVLVACWVT